MINPTYIHLHTYKILNTVGRIEWHGILQTKKLTIYQCVLHESSMQLIWKYLPQCWQNLSTPSSPRLQRQPFYVSFGTFEKLFQWSRGHVFSDEYNLKSKKYFWVNRCFLVFLFGSIVFYLSVMNAHFCFFYGGLRTFFAHDKVAEICYSIITLMTTNSGEKEFELKIFSPTRFWA